jgi:hypothetical protein
MSCGLFMRRRLRVSRRLRVWRGFLVGLSGRTRYFGLRCLIRGGLLLV